MNKMYTMTAKQILASNDPKAAIRIKVQANAQTPKRIKHRHQVRAAVPPAVAKLGFDPRGRLHILGTVWTLVAKFNGDILRVSIEDEDESSYTEAACKDLARYGVDKYLADVHNAAHDFENLLYDDIYTEAVSEVGDGSDDDEDNERTERECEREAERLAEKWMRTDKSVLGARKILAEWPQAQAQLKAALDGLVALHPAR